MANQYKNKIVYNGTILLDLSGDTVTLPEHIMAGFVGHLSDGRQVTGTGQGGGTAAISVVDTEDSHGGTIRTVTALDISDTTAVASDVAQGKYFYTAQGIKTLGTASGGSAPSATSHTIYFEFSDETSATITAYYDSSFISDAIRATTPTTYNNKTVSLAQLDGVTWYEASNIPLNTELIDISAVTFGYSIGEDGTPEEYEWSSITDYTRIDPSMTFSYTCNKWSMYAYYDITKNTIRVVEASDDIDSDDGSNVGYGTLTPSKIPSNAVYVRFTGGYQPSSNTSLSLIRTA